METVTDFIFLAPKSLQMVTCSHEIKRHLLLGGKTMINIDSILKSRDMTFPTSYGFSIHPVMYRCESWTIKKAEC